MIRTALSFCVLFGALAAASRWLIDSPHHEPANAATEAAPAFEPRTDEAKPLPPASAHAHITCAGNPVQLVGFEGPLDTVSLDAVSLDSKPTTGVKARVEDEEFTEEDATPSNV